VKTSEIIGAIDDHRASRKIKKSELARAAGLRPGNVRKIFSKDNPNVDLVTLYRLMNPLGLRLTCSEAQDPLAFIAFFDSVREESGLSCWQLADLAGTDSSNLKRMFASENPRPRLDLLLDLAQVLEVSMAVVRRHDAPTDSTLLRPVKSSKNVSQKQASPKQEAPNIDKKPKVSPAPDAGGHRVAQARQPSVAEKATKEIETTERISEPNEEPTPKAKTEGNEPFEAKRKKWPEHQEWSDTGHVREDQERDSGEASAKGPTADNDRSGDAPPRTERVEWDRILNEPPQDEAAGSKRTTESKWVLTVAGVFVLVVVFTASAVGAAALGNKLREGQSPAASKKPFYKNVGLLCTFGGAIAVVVGASRVKNTAARHALIAAGVGAASGAVAGAAIAARRGSPSRPGIPGLSKFW